MKKFDFFLFSVVLLFFGILAAFSMMAQPVYAAETIEKNLKDPEEYLVMPLMLANPNAEISRNNLIDSLVYDQGYEAHCANKEWKISKDLWGDIEQYFNSNSAENINTNGPVLLSSTDPYNANLTRAHIPLLRGMEPSSETLKNSSFEGLFGANVKVGENFFATDEAPYLHNAAGVSERLLTSYQQCVVKKQNIDAIDRICQYFQTGPCLLDKEVDSKLGKILLSDIAGRFQEVRPNLRGEELNKQVCFDITSGKDEKESRDYVPPAVSTSKLNELSNLVSTAAIDIDGLYRLAFLILVPRQDPADDADQFSFLQSGGINAPLDAPIVVAFKIPEFSTNKSYTINNIDSLEITKLALQTREQNQEDRDNQKEKRETLQEESKNAKQLSNSEKVINCEGMPQCLDTKENILRNTLIDIVNASQPDCKIENLTIIDSSEDAGVEEAKDSSIVADIFNQEDIHYEKAGDLFSPANKDLVEYKYLSDKNNNLINRITSDESQIFNWNLLVNQNPPQKGSEIIVNAYLVLPIGETVKDANKSLAVFWNKDTFLEMVKSNSLIDMNGKTGAIPKFYTIKGEKAEFNGKDAYDYCSRYDEITTLDEDGNEIVSYQCAEPKSFGLNLTDDKKSLLFPDFGLGWMLRKIQLAVRSTANSTYEYVASCQRIEDLFLGRCGGSSLNENLGANCDGVAFSKVAAFPSASGIPSEAQEFFNNSIAPKITQEHIDAYAAAEQATGIPCEVAAGVHWTEGGSELNQSLLDGGNLRGGTLREDAIAAMEFLKGILIANGDDPENLSYAALVNAIAAYNGPGNKNCSSWSQSLDGQTGYRPTRWRDSGKCGGSLEPAGTDQPHPVAWIDSEHTDMDLIFCIDAVEFSCNVNPASANLEAIKARITRSLGITDEATLNTMAERAVQFCFAGSPACAISNGRKYPQYVRPGSLTTALMLNAAGN